MAALILFIVALTYFYEEYSHAVYRDSYVRWKYATVIFLGAAGLTTFVLGVGWLAQNLATK